ncbi:MAG: class I SAM-dependent methyltransferase [Gammaproteobacteria bacterium]|nr:class I SAM-dependent methyltransferase [Gammaproteobacteria bacterium]
MTAFGEPQAQVAHLFDQLADGYDRAALRFFPFAADRLAQRLAPRPGEKILDVATGTGAVAVAVGQRLSGNREGGGRIMAVDISERMLDRAYANVRRMALHNVDLHPMDAAALEFRDSYFDALTCSFGLFFLPDMAAALREWRRVLRPGGRLLLTSFGSEAFQPLAGWFCEQLQVCGGPAVNPADFAWQRLATAEVCTALLASAGFEQIECATEQLGYHLQAPQEWWDVVWNTGFRGRLATLDAAALERFQQQHLERVGAAFADGTLWLNVPVLFVSASVPGA